MAREQRQHGSKASRTNAMAQRRVKDTDLTAGAKLHIIRLLKNSTNAEIADILKQIGFRSSTAPAKPSAEQVRTALAAELRKYVGTPKGRAELDRRRAELANEEAKRYLATSEGRKCVEKAFAQLVAGQITDDDDLLNRLCRDAAQHEVDIWLNSHRGQKTVESLVERAIEERVLERGVPDQKDWIRRKLRDLNDGKGQA